MFQKNIYFFSLLFAFPGLVSATPVIGGINGNIIHGSTFTIIGSSLGAKPVAAPFMWDNFENGTEGSPLSNARWGVKTLAPIISSYNSSNLRNSYSNTLSLYSEILCTNAPSFWLDSVTGTRKIYLNMWVYYDHGDGEPLSGATYQVKPWRLHGGTGSYNIQAPSVPIFCWDSPVDGDNNANYYTPITYSGAAIPASPIYGAATPTRADIENGILFNNYWMNVQWEFSDSSGIDVYDAYLKVYYSYKPSQSHAYFTGEIPHTAIGQVWATRISGKDNGPIDSILFQNYINALSGGANIYYDDIYIDDTWARVEIGDASTYNNCTHREIQIPTAWSNTSIAITINQGSFNTGDVVYLYVADENGVTNTSGYPITIGDTMTASDLTSPAAPSKLSIR